MLCMLISSGRSTCPWDVKRHVQIALSVAPLLEKGSVSVCRRMNMRTTNMMA